MKRLILVVLTLALADCGGRQIRAPRSGGITPSKYAMPRGMTVESVAEKVYTADPQTFRRTVIAQLGLFELTDGQESGLSFQDGDVWYNGTQECLRIRVGGINTCTTMGSSAVQAVSFVATPTFNTAAAGTFIMTLTGNVTSSTASNAVSGRMINFVLCQDGTGSRTFAWPTTFLNPPTIGSGVSVCTTAQFVYDGTNWREISSSSRGSSILDTLTVGNLDNIRLVDGVKFTTIAAADADLGANSGEIWVSRAITTIPATTISANHTLRFTQGGTYTLTGKITMASGSCMIGPMNGMADGSNVGQIILALGANLASEAVLVSGNTACIQGITFDGVKATYTSSSNIGIKITGLRASLDAVNVWRFKGHGIQVLSSGGANGAASPKFHKVMSLANDGDNLDCQETSDGFISMSEFENGGAYGVDLEQCYGWRIRHSDISGSTLIGLRITSGSTANGAQNSIIGNGFGNNMQGDIFVDGDNGSSAGGVANIIEGNSFVGLSVSATDNTYSAVKLQDSGHNTVANNTCNSVASHRYKYCVEVVSVDRTELTDNVTGNRSFGTVGTGHFLGAASTYLAGNGEGTGTRARLVNYVLVNNDPITQYDASTTLRNILGLGGDNVLYAFGHPTKKTITLQPNPGVASFIFTDTGSSTPLQITSTLATGTAPRVTASTTEILNENVQKWHNKDAIDFSDSLSFGSIAAGVCADLTITATGAVANNPIAPSWPVALETGLAGLMFITANDTVTVRLCNTQPVAAIDPANGQTFAGRVIK